MHEAREKDGALSLGKTNTSVAADRAQYFRLIFEGGLRREKVEKGWENVGNGKIHKAGLLFQKRLTPRLSR